MHYSGEITMTRSLLRTFVRISLGWRTTLLLAAAAIAIAWQVIAGDGPSRRTGAVLLTVLVIALAMFELSFRRTWRRMRTTVSEPWRYSVTDSGVCIETPGTSAAIAWSRIQKVRTSAVAWVLTVTGSRGLVVVPRAAFSPEDQGEIDALVAAREAPRAT